MASRGQDHSALWAKLYELELQLAAYKLLRAARQEEEEDLGGAWDPARGGAACCRGRQYDAYMRRRDARRVAAVATAPEPQQPRPRCARAGGGGGGGRPSQLTVKCPARDTREVKRTPAAVSAIPATPSKEHGPLARSRTVSSGAAAARSQHQRRNSVAGDVPADFGDCATPRPFLKRGSGTGGATVRLRALKVHDLPVSDVPSSSPSPGRRPQDHFTPVAVAGRHHRSVSELPFYTATAMNSPRPVQLPPSQARPRKRWGSPETPPAIFSAAATNPHMDLAKGLKKLLSFVRKGKSTEHQHIPARSGSGGDRDSGGKPVKGWTAATACSVLDGPFDRASLEGHQFPMTRAVGTSG